MKTLEDIELWYFVGIGGIGMSALARYFSLNGKIVMGYDRQRSALTTALEMEGIEVSYSDRIGDLPMLLHSTPKEKICIVYTPAISPENPLMQWFQNENYSLRKRSVILGEITKKGKTIAVGGTHGKTTTSALIAHLLYASGHGCNAFLGGIMTNYGSNMLHSGPKAWNVVEADEFDRSFLTLAPNLAVITSLDADHLDIYGEAGHLLEAYRNFADLVNESGKRIICDRAMEQLNRPGQTYGSSAQANFRAGNLRYTDHGNTFDLSLPDGRIWEALPLPLPGQHNLENTTAAIASTLFAGLTEEEIRASLKTFRGIKRRFEYQENTGKVIFIDDYAHHPEEIKATINAVRQRHPNKEITGIFQPHLYSRTRDLAEGFASSLALLDKVLLLDIYPAREKPIPGIDSQWLLDKIPGTHKKCIDKSQLLLEIRKAHPEVLLTLGAGDIDREVPSIQRMLEEEYK